MCNFKVYIVAIILTSVCMELISTKPENAKSGTETWLVIDNRSRESMCPRNGPLTGTDKESLKLVALLEIYFMRNVNTEESDCYSTDRR
jgi:hypothetical protein